MKFLIALVCALIVAIAAENDKWAWSGNREAAAKSDAPSLPSSRFGFTSDYNNGDGLNVGFAPENPGPYGPESIHIRPSYHGNKRPGGPSGLIIRPLPSGPDYNGYEDGYPVPSWIRDDYRYRDFDTCRCRHTYNCPSGALKLGTCARDRRICCFNSRYPGYNNGNSYDRPYNPYNPYNPNSFDQQGSTYYPSYNNYYDNRYPHDNHNGHRYPSYGNNNLYPNGYDDYRRPYGRPYNRYDNLDVTGPQDIDDLYSRSLKRNQTNDSPSSPSLKIDFSTKR